MPRTKQTYSTALILQYKFGMLSDETEKAIPSSTRSNWKKRDINKIIGIEREEDIDIEHLKLLLQHQKLMRIAKALYMLLQTYKKLLNTFSTPKERMKRCGAEIAEAIRKAMPIIGKKRAVRAFGITEGQWNYWQGYPKGCEESLLNLCRHWHPFQLLASEVATIKSYLGMEEYKHWPLTSIYYQMMRDGKAFCAKSTFFRYARKLGFQKSYPRNRRMKHQLGLRAKAPAEWLHMDVTIFRPLDHSKVFIYLLVDNFSRFILSATASTQYNAHTSLQNLKKGMDAFPKHLSGGKSKLLTDGGAENQGELKSYISKAENLAQFIAQRDIQCSNSMVEASNKQLKYQYLFRKEYASFQEVAKQLPAIIADYNHKPHSALYGLTPAEAFLEGIKPDKHQYAPNKEVAKEKRIQANKAQHCHKCQP